MHRLIDTHIHVWNFQRAEYEWLKNDSSILNRNYDIEELSEERVQAGVSEGILVQAANNIEDTMWMLEVAEKTSWISGVVGWLPLTDPEGTARALSDGYASNSYFKGVRHLVHDEPDPEWLLQDTVIQSLRVLNDHNLPYDIVGILPVHIKTALQVAAKVPGLKMVFDHMNQPPVSTREKYGVWGQLMAEAARHDNFYIKISGLGTTSKNFSSWGAEDIKPYVEFGLNNFGEDRCFLGGDWPVSLLAGSYKRTWNVYKDVIGFLLNEEAQQKLFYRNAEHFYNLE